MKFIENNTVKLEVIKQQNNPSNKWVLFIPGAVNSAAEVAQDLKEASFNYYILSLRGRGKSDSPQTSYSLTDQASDIEAFLNQLDENIELSVFAHSLGVPIAIKALSNTTRKIENFVQCDFAPFYPPFDKNWADRVKKQKLQSISTTAIDGIVKDAQYIDVAKELASIETNLYLAVGSTQFSALRDKEKNILQERIPKLHIKTFNGGHELLMENNTEMLSFLEDVLI